jgi:hypothetical protein
VHGLASCRLISNLPPEAAWTADPLERYGSFSNMSVSSESFPSSLAPQAKAVWSVVAASLSSAPSSTVTLHVSFPDVQWSFLRLAYGWSSTQWQAWMRGLMSVPASAASKNGLARVRLWASGPIELVINGQRHWGGDFYAFERTPLILYLPAGVDYTIDARIVRDVRSMGGIDEDPAADIKFHAEFIGDDDDLEVRRHTAVLPDLVDGVVPAGRMCSFAVTNVGLDWLQLVDVVSGEV